MNNNSNPLNELEASRKQESSSGKSMSIIALLGEDDIGKTTTLSYLVVLLLGGGKLNKDIKNAFDKRFKKANGLYKDSHHIIHYKNSEGKEACIYVSTNGDTWTVVENNFEFFYGLCDGRTKVHEFEYSKMDFVKRAPLKKDNPPCPDLCISPANLNNGAIHAEHYYLSKTRFDWKSQLWIRKKELKDDNSDAFAEDNEIMANLIIKEIDRMI